MEDLLPQHLSLRPFFDFFVLFKSIGTFYTLVLRSWHGLRIFNYFFNSIKFAFPIQFIFIVLTASHFKFYSSKNALA